MEKGTYVPLRRKLWGKTICQDARDQRSVTFWGEKQPTTVYQASLPVAKARTSL